MKPLHVDFAPPSQWPPRICMAACAMFLALAAQQGWEAWRLRQDLNSLRQGARDLEARIAKSQQEQAERARSAAIQPPYWQDLVAAQKLAAFPMNRVFRSLESAQVAGVRITSIDITTVDGLATADLEYTGNPALLSYLAALNEGEPRQRWKLVRAKTEGAGQQGSALIQSQWNQE